MKILPDDENEVHDISGFRDQGQNVITSVMQLSPSTMSQLVGGIKSIVLNAHSNSAFLTQDQDGVTRAQIFEEGRVFLLEKPFEKYPTDRYLMAFYDVNEQGICSRMHVHTGTRFVRIMTGADTTLRISSLSPFKLHDIGFSLLQIQDEMFDITGKHPTKRFSVLVPENSIVDVQIPAGVSHQFNADGPNAVIDSVHPEETIEMLRENISRPNMMSQTIFLEKDHPPARHCTTNASGRSSPGNQYALAASFVLYAAITAYSFWAIPAKIHSNFKAQNPETTEVKLNQNRRTNIADATYGPHPISKPESVLLPTSVLSYLESHKSSKINLHEFTSAACQTTLRAKRGNPEPQQEVFQYLLSEEGRFQVVTVTPENFSNEISSLYQHLNL